jgi:hypothetical protein
MLEARLMVLASTHTKQVSRVWVNWCCVCDTCIVCEYSK